MSDSPYFPFSCSQYTCCQTLQVIQIPRFGFPSQPPLSLSYHSLPKSLQLLLCSLEFKIHCFKYWCQQEHSPPRCQPCQSTALRVLCHRTRSPEVRKLWDQPILWSAMPLMIQVLPSFPFHYSPFAFASPFQLKDSCCNSRSHKQKPYKGVGQGPGQQQSGGGVVGGGAISTFIGMLLDQARNQKNYYNIHGCFGYYPID